MVGSSCVWLKVCGIIICRCLCSVFGLLFSLVCSDFYLLIMCCV